jgi:hypothetical protein
MADFLTEFFRALVCLPPSRSHSNTRYVYTTTRRDTTKHLHYYDGHRSKPSTSTTTSTRTYSRRRPSTSSHSYRSRVKVEPRSVLV